MSGYCQEPARGKWLDLATIDARLRSLIDMWAQLSESQQQDIVDAARPRLQGGHA
jgi:hypothetical protein